MMAPSRVLERAPGSAHCTIGVDLNAPCVAAGCRDAIVGILCCVGLGQIRIRSQGRSRKHDDREHVVK